MRRFIAPILTTALLVVGLDAWFKSLALAYLPADTSLVNPGWFTLAIHPNYGIAFDLPLKLPIILIVSVVLGAALVHLAWEHGHQYPATTTAALLVVIGGAGNVIDRVAYGFTVDYLLLFGRTAINLSDLIILTGIIWLLWDGPRQTARKKSLTNQKKDDTMSA